MTAPHCAGHCLTIDQLVTRLAVATGTPETLVRLGAGIPPQAHTEAPTTPEPSTVYHPPRYPQIPAAPDDPETWCLP